MRHMQGEVCQIRITSKSIPPADGADTLMLGIDSKWTNLHEYIITIHVQVRYAAPGGSSRPSKYQHFEKGWCWLAG